MMIRAANETDLNGIVAILLSAFEASEREVIVQLVRELLADPTASPVVSLVAECEAGELAGYVLFSRVRIAGTERPVRAAILAPLAVQPDYQGKGIGGRLVREGLQRLQQLEVVLVFVLGDPGYYGRFGFKPAGRLGLQAPYPVPEAYADAWMVLALHEGELGAVTGTVRCAGALDRPELWLE